MSVCREPAFAEGEYRRRLAAVHARMAQRQLDGILLFGAHNVNYLTGMDSENLFEPAALRGRRGSRSSPRHSRFRARPL